MDHVREVTADMWEGGILTVGKPLLKEEETYKLSMPEGLGEPEEMERLLQMADVILIEADGAKKKPVKVPGEWEPVIIPQTGLVIACAGLSALGGTFADTCFRFREYGKWLMREGENVITPEDLALILMDERGSHQGSAGPLLPGGAESGRRGKRAEGGRNDSEAASRNYAEGMCCDSLPEIRGVFQQKNRKAAE